MPNSLIPRMTFLFKLSWSLVDMSVAIKLNFFRANTLHLLCLAFTLQRYADWFDIPHNLLALVYTTHGHVRVHQGQLLGLGLLEKVHNTPKAILDCFKRLLLHSMYHMALNSLSTISYSLKNSRLEKVKSSNNNNNIPNNKVIPRTALLAVKKAKTE